MGIVHKYCGRVYSLQFIDDTTLIMSGSGHSEDGIFHRYNLDDLSMDIFKGHKKSVFTFDYCNGWLASGSEDNTIKVWSPTSSPPVGMYSFKEKKIKGAKYLLGVGHVLLTRGHTILSVPRGSSEIHCWNIFGKLLERFAISVGRITAITKSPRHEDGHPFIASCAIATSAFEICIWNLLHEGGRSYKASISKQLWWHNDTINSLAYHPIGKNLVSVSDDLTIKYWDTETAELLNSYSPHSGRIFFASFSPNGDWVASASPEDGVFITDPSEGSVLGFIRDRGKAITLAVSPNQSYLAIGNREGEVKIYRIM